MENISIYRNPFEEEVRSEVILYDPNDPRCKPDPEENRRFIRDFVERLSKDGSVSPYEIWKEFWNGR